VAHEIKHPLLAAQIRAATRRLRVLGKTPSDAINLLRHITRSKASNRKPYGFVAADWRRSQVWAALELAYLSGLRELLRSASVAPKTIVTLALDYADARENRVRCQANETILKLLPDYRRGKKARTAGAEAHGSSSSRFQRALRLNEINRKILMGLLAKRRHPDVLNKIARNKRVADQFEKRYGKAISYKTVERDLSKLLRTLLHSIPS
jgi:hypothetical protein